MADRILTDRIVKDVADGIPVNHIAIEATDEMPTGQTVKGVAGEISTARLAKGMACEMLTGRIVKGVAGVYDVVVPERGRYACPARGLFRKQNATPVPGDLAVITNIDEHRRTGYLHALLPRRNELPRPKAANMDQALLVFAAASPEISFIVLDIMLAFMEYAGVRPVICVNKVDLATDDRVEGIISLYAKTGYRVLPISAVERKGTWAVEELLPGKTTILAGPSGVGKSSLINALFPGLSLQTGELSRKIERGKNTTRYCELFEIGQDTYIADSPGFTSFDASVIPTEQLQYCFPEFKPFLGQCFYTDCLHNSEHDCVVKANLGISISQSRYDNYISLLKRQ